MTSLRENLTWNTYNKELLELIKAWLHTQRANEMRKRRGYKLLQNENIRIIKSKYTDREFVIQHYNLACSYNYELYNPKVDLDNFLEYYDKY